MWECLDGGNNVWLNGLDQGFGNKMFGECRTIRCGTA